MVLIFPIGVPAVFFTVMYKYRLRIDELVIRLKRHDDENNSFTSVREHTVIALAHGATNDPQQTSSLSRRQSFATQATDLLWLAKKIDMFKPGRWWTSGFLISMRIVQTSVMFFFTKPQPSRSSGKSDCSRWRLRANEHESISPPVRVSRQ